MPSLLTAKDQEIWTQRIRREEGVNTKVNKDGFSVRCAIKSVDVPKRFKPGHVDPTKPETMDGFHPGSKHHTDLKQLLVKEQAQLRDKLKWPDTSAQDHGWYQKDPATGATQPGRSSIAGALPRAGFGWVPKPQDEPLPEYDQVPSRKQVERPPFAFTSKEALHAVRQKSMERGGPARGGSHAGADRRAQSLGLPSSSPVVVSGHPSLPGGSRLTLAGKAASTPSLVKSKPDANILPEDDLEGLEAAMKRSRIFMNRHGSYKWYKPLGNSDVSAFVDAYTKCWAKPFYAKSSAKGN
jgi:hypothetical protein